MIERFFRITTYLILQAVIICFSPAQQLLAQTEVKADQQEQSLRILFIGNSYTNFNDLPSVLSKLAASAKPAQIIETAQYSPNGYDLAEHWKDGTAVERIKKDRWDFVVLQEASMLPVDAPKKVLAFAKEFDKQIKQAGAKTVLFMTWARQHKPKMIRAVSRTYNSIGRKLDAVVVPVGKAWQRSLRKYPDIALHKADKSHPNQHGTYLAACVFYSLITARNPEGLSNGGLRKVTKDQARSLQQIAWETAQEQMKKKEKEPASETNKTSKVPDKKKK